MRHSKKKERLLDYIANRRSEKFEVGFSFIILYHIIKSNLSLIVFPSNVFDKIIFFSFFEINHFGVLKHLIYFSSSLGRQTSLSTLSNLQFDAQLAIGVKQMDCQHQRSEVNSLRCQTNFNYNFQFAESVWIDRQIEYQMEAQSGNTHRRQRFE